MEILRYIWDNFKIFLRSFWNTFGIPINKTFKILLAYFWNTLGIHKGYFWDTLRIFRDTFWHTSKYLLVIMSTLLAGMNTVLYCTISDAHCTVL